MFKQCQRSTSPFFANLDQLVPKWPWKSRSINTIFNRALEGPIIHNWCKFGDPSSKAWWLIAPKSLFFTNLDHFSAQMTLKVKVNLHHFQEDSGESHDTHLVHIWWPYLKSKMRYYTKQSVFRFFRNVLAAKWPWRSRSINTIFNRLLEGSMIHILCKFGDHRFKSWRVTARTSPFLADLDRFSPKWPWRSRSNTTIYNTVRELLKIHL